MLKQTMLKQTMLKQIICITLLSTLAGCALTKEPVSALGPVPIDAAVLDASLSHYQQDVIAAIDANTLVQTAELTALSEQIKALKSQVAKQSHNSTPAKVVIPTQAQCPISPLGDKFLLGAVEYVYIEEIKATFKTRIDTGAESSSLDAHNIVLFERDSKQWVRFDVSIDSTKAPARTFESKVAGFVRIKQEADGKSDRRPVILAHLQIGDYKAETELNLVNRSHLEFPLLLGRKFMQDIAVVDVAQTYIHGKKKPAQIEKQ